jgi:hypothetical protein
MPRTATSGRLLRIEKARRVASASGGRLSSLQARAEALARLREMVASALPAHIAQQCQLANLRGETAVFICSSASWATRLRYMEPQLGELLQRLEGGAVRRLQIRVATPAAAPAPAASQRNAALGEGAVSAIERAAALIGDPDLSAALRRLARGRGAPGNGR